VEAYPNQHTVVASCDPDGRFYDMWFVNQHGQVRMCRGVFEGVGNDWNSYQHVELVCFMSYILNGK